MNPAIGLSRAADGGLTYLLPFRPRDTPAVTTRALLDAWREARAGAEARLDGPPRRLVFAGHDGEDPVRLLLSDPDAGCWAEAIDAAFGLDSAAGMALLLRLLALLEALVRLPWLRGMLDLDPAGTGLHPELLAAAAGLPLDAEARLEEASLRRRFRRLPGAAHA